MSITDKIKATKTIPQLDLIRLDVIKAVQADGEKSFHSIQKVFRAQKNKLTRIPLRERTW